MNRFVFLLLMVCLLGACARPPKLSSSLVARRKANGIVALIVTVKNVESRPTTPISVEVTAEMQTATGWSKPEPVMHPAPFVLNRNEERSVITNVHTDSRVLRTNLVLKEAETGRLLKSEKAITRIGA